MVFTILYSAICVWELVVPHPCQYLRIFSLLNLAILMGAWCSFHLHFHEKLLNKFSCDFWPYGHFLLIQVFCLLKYFWGGAFYHWFVGILYTLWTWGLCQIDVCITNIFSQFVVCCFTFSCCLLIKSSSFFSFMVNYFCDLSKKLAYPKAMEVFSCVFF